MSAEHKPRQCLSADEIVVLKFAAHRQLARWAHKEKLSRHQQTRRIALIRAVRTLEDKAFVDGCELHGFSARQSSPVPPTPARENLDV